MTEFSTLARIVGGLGAAALLLWVGWSRERRVPDTSKLQASAEQQKVLTAAAVDWLRAAFGAGQSIYEKVDRLFAPRPKSIDCTNAIGCETTSGYGSALISIRPRPTGLRSGLFWSKDRPYLQKRTGALG